jgi:hypothetical protein
MFFLKIFLVLRGLFTEEILACVQAMDESNSPITKKIRK